MTASLGYFPGCSLHGAGKEYEISLKAVVKALSQSLEEIPGWLCCGATSAHAIDHALATALAGDTLAKAQDAGFKRVFAPCAMCYSRLATVSQEIKQDPNKAAKLEKALKRKKTGLAEIEPLGILDWLRELNEAQITEPAKRPLNGLKVACYYGCLLVRPQKVTKVVDAENPQDMERVLRLLGAEPVKWNMATSCCGASFSLSDKPAVLRLCKAIIDDAANSGAQAIVVACPMCHSNLDMRQPETKPTKGMIPVAYITELMGLAYGYSAEDLGLGTHTVNTNPLIEALEPTAKG